MDNHARHLLNNIILATSFNSTELGAELSKFEATSIAPFLSRVLRDSHLEVLAIGNILAEEATAMANSAHAYLNGTGLDAAKRPCQRVLKLAEGITYVHRHPAVNEHEENSACISYLQVRCIKRLIL